ncbi:MAG: 3-dehydroquinate synthase [Bacteroidia bacterium]
MDFIQQSFSVNFQYRVFFTENLFSRSNPVLSDFFRQKQNAETKQKVLFVIDQGVIDCHPALAQQIDDYFSIHTNVQLISEKVILPGGETVKNDEVYFKKIIDRINRHSIDRHSYVAAIGGGSALDLVGYSTAIAHRGINHIRIPTTVLSQNDSGVGVKNGINYLGKKNFLGTFAPPVAVFNDASFLLSLNERHWLSGISEAIKVALIKVAGFFDWIEAHAEALAARDLQAMKQLIRRCAELHILHIGSGDPFETGSSRPLDFGHWSAHKLEQLTNFEVLHGEAVAIGICLDSIYSQLSGRLSASAAERIIRLFIKLGLPITHPAAMAENDQSPILQGLQEFREHLGGRLTIMLLKEIGQGEEAHEMDPALLGEAARHLQRYLQQPL